MKNSKFIFWQGYECFGHFDTIIMTRNGFNELWPLTIRRHYCTEEQHPVPRHYKLTKSQAHRFCCVTEVCNRLFFWRKSSRVWPLTTIWPYDLCCLILRQTRNGHGVLGFQFQFYFCTSPQKGIRDIYTLQFNNNPEIHKLTNNITLKHREREKIFQRFVLNS